MRILLAAIYPYVFILLYLIIPFDEYVRALPNILMLILVIAFPFIISKKDFQKLFKKPTLFIGLFIVFLTVNSILQGRIEQDFSFIKAMLIPIGLVLLCLPIKDFKKLNKAIIFSSFIAIVYTLVQFLILVNQNSEVSIAFFQETVDALLIDRVYLGLLCVLSIIISYQALAKEYHPDNKYYFTSIIINISYLLLIMSKTALVILFIVLILRQFYGKDRKIKLGVTSIILVILLITTYFKFPTIFENPFQSNKDISEVNYTESTIPLGYRAQIWDCASIIMNANSNNLFGIGFKETSNKLVECYQNNINDPETRQNFIEKRFNTHNQYLDFYISSGIISLLFFLGILVFLLLKNHKLFFPTALIITIILFGLVENYLHRQVGAYYIGFILVILLINNENILDKKTNESLSENS